MPTIIGFLIMVVSLVVLTAGRDAAIVVWVNKLFDGDADTTFKAAQTADKVIDHTLKALLFVGLSFIKLGIGFAIATIVRNLRATGRSTVDAYSSAGVAEAEAHRFTEPWFGRYFTRLLFGGMLVVLFFFVLTLWWDANLVFLKRAQFDGQTTGTAYQTYLVIERILDPIIGSGKFVGEGMMILGIATGLATIITNLSVQARALPVLTRRAFGRDGGQGPGPVRPIVPGALVKLAIAGASLLALAFPLAIIRSAFIGGALARQFDGEFSLSAVRMDGLLERAIDPLINLGLGTLFFAIAFLLLTIIGWLRQQRKGFGDAVADLSAGSVPRPVVEPSLWPQRLIAPLAIFGIFVILFFFFAMTPVRMINFDGVLTLQSAGATGTVQFQNADRLDDILKPVIGATRLIGIGALMLAIGLALVTIVVHLRATALLLPVGFSRLIPAARGEEPEDDEEIELTLAEPMALAPWDLLRPHLVGLAILVSATLPVVVLYAVSIHRNLAEQYAGRGDPGAMSGLFKSSFLSAQLFNASWTPWALFGMGLILFAIGRFFSTIVGFVEARRMVIGEGTAAISEAVAADRKVGVPV